MPTIWGEKIVMRLLDPAGLQLNLANLGFERPSLEAFQRAINQPYGIVLVTGPTGSGKTNTLYSAISTINDAGTNIMTAEDPVEFNLEGINQVQINDAVGLSFAAALRSFLRQDRDRARANGMITLRESGLAKIWQGVTSVEEVLRETSL